MSDKLTKPNSIPRFVKADVMRGEGSPDFMPHLPRWIRAIDHDAEIERLTRELAGKEADCVRLHKQFMDAKYGPQQSEPRDEPEFAKADASTATFQEAYDRQVKSEAKQYVYFAAEPSLIVSAEEAKQPLAFRHWTKDAGVPYAGCHCDTCISVSRAEPRGEFVRFPDPPYEFRGDSGKIECPLCHGDGSVYPREHTKP